MKNSDILSVFHVQDLSVKNMHVAYDSIFIGYGIYIVKYLALVHMSPPYKRVPNISQYKFNYLLITVLIELYRVEQTQLSY